MRSFRVLLMAALWVTASTGSGTVTPTTRPTPDTLAGFGVIAPATASTRGVNFSGCLAGSARRSCFSTFTSDPSGARAALATPGAPSNLVASSTGSSATLTWSAPAGGDPPTAYVIEAGSATGRADLAIVSTGSPLTIFQASGVGAGTYFIRVRAVNSGGTSGPSNEALLTVGAGPCSTQPGAPSGLTITFNAGGVVSLAWTAANGSPTSYIIEAGSTPGLSNLANSDLAGTGTQLTAAGVGAGTYYVRVRAKNGCGVGPPSNELVLTVGSPGPTPTPTETAEAITRRCPTAAEVSAIDVDLTLRFDADPTAGTIVCSAAVSGRALTFLESQAYLSLVIMRRLSFSAPLPWTSQSLYAWTVNSIRGIRFRSDITYSFCCDPPNFINIQNGVAIAQPELPRLPIWVFGFSALVVHETRHNNGYPHTCGNNDQSVQEMGAWGVQYLLQHWIVNYSDPSFVSTDLRGDAQRSRDNLCGQFCQSCTWP